MGKKFGTFVITALMLLAVCKSHGKEIVLADGGQTNYRVVLPAGADLSTRAVALDFAGILQEMTGALFPVYMDNFDRPAEYEIILGRDNLRLKELDLENLGKDFSPGEYEIRTHGKYIVIAGAGRRGTINGIYGFLQDDLGCRWLTPGCQYIPKKETIRLGEIYERQKPAFRWRSTCSPMQWDADWCIRNRLNESKARTCGPRPSAFMLIEGDARAATMANTWSPHAFQEIPEELYKEHPDWRAEIDGKREYIENPVQRAYCMTNEDFTSWVAEWTKDKLRKNPMMEFVSITNGDNGNSCHCKQCQASDDRVGISGTSIEFASRVAEEVVKEFPSTSIITFAYQHTFATTTAKAHPNLRIIWAPIHADYAHALDDGIVNQKENYIGQLKQWKQNVKQLGIWYYQDSIDVPLPRPSFFVMQRNFQIFRELGVDQVFVEMYFNSSHKNTWNSDGDKSIPAYACVEDYYSRKKAYSSMIFSYGLEHLRGYIISRLLWNQDFDWQQGIREFCDIYYGDAGNDMATYAVKAEMLSSYNKTMSNMFKDYPGIYMHFSRSPRMKLLLLEEFDALFDSAESKVKDNQIFLRRLEMARMSVDLALLEHPEAKQPLRKKAFDRFFSLAEEIGLASNINGVSGGSHNIIDLKKTLAKTID